MKYLPIMLDLSRIKVIIFGGGKVAYRKLNYFEGADITIVSENFLKEISKKNVRLLRKKIIDPEEARPIIKDADLVIIATNDKSLNSSLMGICEDEKKIYNLVDDKKSKAIFPACYNEKDIILAISTSGRAPALSTFLRDELSKNLKRYSNALDIVEKIRKSINSHNEQIRKKYFRVLFESKNFWELIDKKDFEKAYQLALKVWRDMDVSS
ncbi:MAG: precorrin-2 dehydrogenase/sirohydrochlorin ferrochelatase family protein [Thermoplasmata archaeon]